MKNILNRCGSVKTVRGRGNVATVLPHPQSLSRWEREAAIAARSSSEISPADTAANFAGGGARFSLSQRERAGVRENSRYFAHSRFLFRRAVRCFFLLCALCVLCGSTSFAQPTEVQFLSGHGKDDAVPWKFLCTSGANSGAWTNLPVPSQWDVRGFGTLTYHKDATNAYDERGLYEHEFFVVENWRGKRIFLVFDGVMTDTDAKLNGQSVGAIHQGSFYRFKYEVTSLVKFGATNKLEVNVARHSANESVNKAERLADYWVFAGIFRPVYLEAVPSEFIERVAIDAKADGSFSAQVFLGGTTAGTEIEAQIQTLDGKNVSKTVAAGILPAVEPGFQPGGKNAATANDFKNSSASISSNASPGGRMPPSTAGRMPAATIRAQTASPKLWTAETPNLYNAVFSLKQNGNVIHTFTQRFGFRTMEVRDGDGLYVNGQKIILKGADRHSFWPESGRCLSEAVHRLDIGTMKDANMNAVRMSHYPPDAQFLDLCDELGLYVLDELAGWHNHYDREVGAKLVHEMLARDVNHPCILFWDNGNEGGWNTNLDHIFPELDPQQRRVLHPWATFSGVNTAHYLAYDKAEIAAGGKKVYFTGNQELVATNDRAKYIYMPTEFLHGLYDGGAGAGLDDYWRMMTASKTLGGGFIWALVDEGIKRPDTGEIDVAGNQAPDGIVGPYRQREGSFYTIKEIWSPIQITRDAKGGFKLENHFSFTDASECAFEFELRQLETPGSSGTGILPVSSGNFAAASKSETHRQDACATTNCAALYTVLTSGKIPAPKIAPGRSGDFKFSPPLNKNADALALRVNDPAGRELWTWVWPLKKDLSHRLAEEPATQHAVPSATNGVITVTAGELTATFSEQTGLLTGVQRGAQKFSLTNGPRLATGSATLRDIHFTTDGANAIVAAKFDGDLKSVLWRVNGNGWIQCSWTYAAHGTNEFLGVIFDYPEKLVTHKRWRGDGPFRVWQNRLRGVTAGVWENDYNDTLTGYRGWIYPEFKGFFANWHWLQLGTREGDITVINQGDTKFLQVLTPDFGPDKLKAKAFAPVPACGLGFLDAIPALGSKFKEAKFSGPHSLPTVVDTELSGSVSLYFGKLP